MATSSVPSPYGRLETTGFTELASTYNAPSDSGSLTGRVGFYVLLTVQGFDGNTYETPDWIFVETHSDVYVELSGTDIIGTQWLNSLGEVGNIDGLGVHTGGLTPLWKVGIVTGVNYQLKYPNSISPNTGTPHTFKGITAVAYQNSIDNYELVDTTGRLMSDSGTYSLGDTLNAVEFVNSRLNILNDKEIDTPLDLGDLANMNETYENVDPNVPYGFNDIYSVEGTFNGTGNNIKFNNIKDKQLPSVSTGGVKTNINKKTIPNIDINLNTELQ